MFVESRHDNSRCVIWPVFAVTLLISVQHQIIPKGLFLGRGRGCMAPISKTIAVIIHNSNTVQYMLVRLSGTTKGYLSCSVTKHLKPF